MSGAQVITLVGVFVGGAIPWLEAVVVVPAGIVAGLNPVVAVMAGVVGNLSTVAAAAVFGERIRMWWMAGAARVRVVTSGSPDGADRTRRTGRAARVERVVQRWGLPALAVVGPIGLGTQLSALVAVGLGVDARPAFLWVGAGTVAWSIVAAVVAVAGMSVAGVGG